MDNRAVERLPEHLTESSVNRTTSTSAYVFMAVAAELQESAR